MNFNELLADLKAMPEKAVIATIAKQDATLQATAQEIANTVWERFYADIFPGMKVPLVQLDSESNDITVFIEPVVIGKGDNEFDEANVTLSEDESQGAEIAAARIHNAMGLGEAAIVLEQGKEKTAAFSGRAKGNAQDLRAGYWIERVNAFVGEPGEPSYADCLAFVKAGLKNRARPLFENFANAVQQYMAADIPYAYAREMK